MTHEKNLECLRKLLEEHNDWYSSLGLPAKVEPITKYNLLNMAYGWAKSSAEHGDNLTFVETFELVMEVAKKLGIEI